MEVVKGNKHAKRVLSLREDANFLLVTILWANLPVNVLLALLSGSVLAGIAAFPFSTVVITGDEDLLYLMGIQAVIKGGTVYAVTPEEVPGQALLAAVLRY